MGIIILICWFSKAVDFGSEVLYDLHYTATSPLRWDKKSFIAAGEIGVGTYTIILQDPSIKSFIQSHRNDELADIFELMGNGSVTLSIAGTCWLTGNLTHNTKLQQSGELGFKSLLVSGAITNCLKRLGGRDRAYNTNSSKWIGPTLEEEYQSFPSGHTTVAFALASSIDEFYDNKLLNVFTYSIAALVGWSRMNDNQHWASDVAVAAAIGIATTKAIAKMDKKRLEKKSQNK